MYWQFFLNAVSKKYINRLAAVAALFDEIASFQNAIHGLTATKDTVDDDQASNRFNETLASVKQIFTDLMDCEYISLNDKNEIGANYIEAYHGKLFSLMEMAARFKPDIIRQMLLEACDKHPHFLNDIPYKLIPDAIKDDEHFIQQVHQLGQKIKESSKTMLAKDISNLQHYALWQLQNLIEKNQDISTALEAYLRSLGSGKPNDLAEVVELIKQKLKPDDSKQHIDSCFLKLVFKYPKILNQRENLPTDVFNDPQQQDMLRQHYYFQLAKYTIGMSLGAGFAITGILALAGVLMFPYSISVVALVFGMIMLGTFIWSLQQDNFCAVMANHPFEAVPIEEPNKVVYGFPSAPSVSIENGAANIDSPKAVLLPVL